MYKQTEKAFTFIELMISLTILAIVILGILSGYVGCLKINEMSKSTTIATLDARRIISQMRSLAVDSLADVTAEDWTTWGANNGCANLDSEQVVVTYIDRDGSGDALDDDPLEVTVTINWVDNQRARSLILGTLITVR